MKKILFSIGFFILAFAGNSQTVLNEIYVLPGNGKSEFFELYNNSTNPVPQSVDCYTILTYWESGANKGWYVLDLPNLSIGPKGYFVGAAADPFNTQSTTNSVANFNWNDPSFRNGSSGGSLTKWQVNGTSYTDVSVTIPATLNDLFFGGNGKDYVVLVFVDGFFNNGFIGGSSSPLLDQSTIGSPLPPVLSVPTSCGGQVVQLNVDFTQLGAMENVISQPGSDNGYARTSDGKCGAWAKTSASVNHTPGVTNGSAAGLTGSLTTAQEVLQCNTGPGVSQVTYNITGVSGDASEAADFPVEVQLYYDFGTIGQLDGADVLHDFHIDNAIADPAYTFTIAQTQYVILVYKTARGCFDKVVSVPNGCLPLPVSFKSFTATRSQSNVLLKWETAWEQNNAGFAVERNVNGAWQQVGWVATQAQNGNSDVMLSYTFMDNNNIKGITQYRIRQVDIDQKSTYSAIRSVRGEGQIGKTIVYPNPSNNGKVNVVFEDASVTREIAVSDMSGRVVRQIRGISNNNITIENLNPGMYTIRIIAVETGEQVVQKIVVNKK
ncbi:MAG: T9SS type A sorting domain-containing protein [Chitinophagaceae bacterium]